MKKAEKKEEQKEGRKEEQKEGKKREKKEGKKREKKREKKEEKKWMVEGIVNKKIERGVALYLLKWEGYASSENTWERRDRLIEDGLS